MRLHVKYITNWHNNKISIFFCRNLSSIWNIEYIRWNNLREEIGDCEEIHRIE